MIEQQSYKSIIGNLVITAEDDNLIALSLDNNMKVYSSDNKTIKKVVLWLDEYFSGNSHIIDFQIDIRGTEFQIHTWTELMKIPYGKTITYGELAAIVGSITGKSKMSAQAIGHALNKNPLLLIVPCHRVIGKNLDLIGFGCGLKVKEQLLIHEGHTIKENKLWKK